MRAEAEDRAGDGFYVRGRLAAIVESSEDAIIGKTLDGVVTSWNAAAERMYGYTPAQVIGRSVSVIIPAERAGELDRILDLVRRGERVAHFETKRVRKDGSVIDVSVSVSPILDAGGTVVGAATLARDMTERVQAEAERRALERELLQAERLETLGQVAGRIAHDFNNLLAVIVSQAEFAADEVAGNPRAQADIRQIEAAAQRAARLAKQLLIFGRQDLDQPEALDLNAVVEGVRDLVDTSAGESVRLVVQASDGVPAFVADRGQVEQVLLNLVVNAREAMPGGGTVTVGTRAAEFSGEPPAGVRPGRYAELSVADTGQGISASVLPHIFEPFFTTKPVGQGTGLGLATVHGIATGAGGRVTVDSEEGQGTTFRVLFPAVAAPAPPAEPARAPGETAGETTILVVNDEPVVLGVTARILHRAGYATLEARCGDEAVALAAAHDFQLLLTDSVMPSMPGPVLAERVAELRPGVPVLHMSGFTAGTLDAQRIRDGELAFIQKPFTAEELLDKVRAVLADGVPVGGH